MFQEVWAFQKSLEIVNFEVPRWQFVETQENDGSDFVFRRFFVQNRVPKWLWKPPFSDPQKRLVYRGYAPSCASNQVGGPQPLWTVRRVMRMIRSSLSVCLSVCWFAPRRPNHPRCDLRSLASTMAPELLDWSNKLFLRPLRNTKRVPKTTPRTPPKQAKRTPKGLPGHPQNRRKGLQKGPLGIPKRAKRLRRRQGSFFQFF